MITAVLDYAGSSTVQVDETSSRLGFSTNLRRPVQFAARQHPLLVSRLGQGDDDRGPAGGVEAGGAVREEDAADQVAPRRGRNRSASVPLETLERCHYG